MLSVYSIMGPCAWNTSLFCPASSSFRPLCLHYGLGTISLLLCLLKGCILSVCSNSNLSADEGVSSMHISKALGYLEFLFRYNSISSRYLYNSVYLCHIYVGLRLFLLYDFIFIELFENNDPVFIILDKTAWCIKNKTNRALSSLLCLGSW